MANDEVDCLVREHHLAPTGHIQQDCQSLRYWRSLSPAYVRDRPSTNGRGMHGSMKRSSGTVIQGFTLATDRLRKGLLRWRETDGTSKDGPFSAHRTLLWPVRRHGN